MEAALSTPEKIAEYREAERLGFDVSTMRITHNNHRDQLKHAAQRRAHLVRAIELRKEMGLPAFVETGRAGDANSKPQIDRLSEGLEAVDEEIVLLKGELSPVR
jgi:hypothetical protein